MSNNDKSRKRVEDLFSGMTQLISEASNGHDRPLSEEAAGEPLLISASQLQEMEALRARVCELEARLQEKETKPVSAPIIYEKEQVGFSFDGDQVQPVPSEQVPLRIDRIRYRMEKALTRSTPCPAVPSDSG